MRRVIPVILSLALLAVALELPLAIHLCVAGAEHYADRCLLCAQIGILARVFLNDTVPPGIPVLPAREEAATVPAMVRPNGLFVPAVLPRAPPRVNPGVPDLCVLA